MSAKLNHSSSASTMPVRNAIRKVVAYIYADIAAIFRGVLSSLNIIIFYFSLVVSLFSLLFRLDVQSLF